MREAAEAAVELLLRRRKGSQAGMDGLLQICRAWEEADVTLTARSWEKNSGDKN